MSCFHQFYIGGIENDVDSTKVLNPKILKCECEIEEKSEEAIQQDLKPIQSLVSGPKLMLITVFWQPTDKNHNNIGGGGEGGRKRGTPIRGLFSTNQSTEYQQGKAAWGIRGAYLLRQSYNASLASFIPLSCLSFPAWTLMIRQRCLLARGRALRGRRASSNSCIIFLSNNLHLRVTAAPSCF